MAKWYLTAGDQRDTVVSTRIRLARNIKGYPFPWRLDIPSRLKVNELIIKAAEDENLGLRAVNMKELTAFQAASLAERKIISEEFASVSDGRALLLSEDEDISIMLCEDDHIRLQVIMSGLSLEAALEKANEIDDKLNKRLNFAFDERLGYLTEKPMDLGTGMRASVLLHLPALTSAGQISRLSATVSKLGLSISPVFSGGARSVGDFYQLSNQLTLGISEKAAIANLKSITTQIVNQERAARKELVSSLAGQDGIYRSYGILKSARLLTGEELLEYISYVRLGAAVGILPVSTELLDEMALTLQPASINAAEGSKLDRTERDKKRADMVREKLG
ncbi:MAG: ATP--guanido phosphotransferase [Clostridiales bacterium]|nr:ATP--guanido phosphotransferase [Clostridia bacterium]MCR4563572.1 ATP--guanido phosphotransferase [Clostridiales bacterium]